MKTILILLYMALPTCTIFASSGELHIQTLVHNNMFKILQSYIVQGTKEEPADKVKWALMYARIDSNNWMLEQLLKKNAVKIPPEVVEEEVAFAIQEGNTRALALYMQRFSMKWHGVCPLLGAAHHGRVTMMEMLLARKEQQKDGSFYELKNEINWPSAGDSTPLAIAYRWLEYDKQEAVKQQRAPRTADYQAVIALLEQHGGSLQLFGRT